MCKASAAWRRKFSPRIREVGQPGEAGRIPAVKRWAVVLLLLAACSGGPAGTSARPDLPVLTPAGFTQLLAESDRPVVVNVWASWCIPCRSEMPLLVEAHRQFGDQVRFVGLNVEDSQSAAKAFLDEFGVEYENYFDPGRSIPAQLGGFGVPLTYFVAPGGEVVDTHIGVLDEQALALGIDELLQG